MVSNDKMPFFSCALCLTYRSENYLPTFLDRLLFKKTPETTTAYNRSENADVNILRSFYES